MDSVAAELPPGAATVPPPASPSTGVDYGVTDPAPPPSATAAVPGRWTVGTLTYTSAGLVTLFGYLLAGDFALSMRDRSVGPVVQLMLRRLGASDTTMSVLLSTLPPALALVVGPVVSFKSDRLRGRWGRRIPFLLIPTPVAAAAMFALAYCEPFGHWAAGAVGHGSAAAFSLAWFGLFWTLFESAVVVAAAVVGGLVNDVVPRPLLGRFYGLFRAVSLVAGMVFNFWVMGVADVHFRAILIGMGLLFAVGFTVMCLGVREGRYPPPDPVDPYPLAAGRRLAAVRTYFRECFRDPYYILVFAAITLSAATFLPVNLFSLLYARQLNLSDGRYGKLLTLTYAVSLALAWPMGWLVDRVSAVRAAAGTMAVYAVAMLFATAAVHTGRQFGVALVVHGVLSGAFFTASASLGQTLFPRLKYGQFASAAGIVQSLFTMALGPLLGIALDRSGHDYHLTIPAAGLLAAAGTACLIAVHHAGRSRAAAAVERS